MPLRVEPTPSVQFRRLFIAFHLVFLFCLWLAGLPWWWATAVSAVVAVEFVLLWRSRPELAGPPVRLRWDSEARWFRASGGGEQPLLLEGSSFVAPWLMVLNFRGEVGRFALVLPPDSLDPQTFRRLRVRLRLEGLGPDHDNDPGTGNGGD